MSKTINKSFPFLDLPPEIRNHVYAAVFVDINQTTKLCIRRQSHRCDISKVFKQKLRLNDGPPSGLALLATCRQIRNEAFGFVHGTIDLELRIRDSQVWAKQRLETGDLRCGIQRAIRDLGPNLLHHVRHLDLTGLNAICLLASTEQRAQAFLRDCFDRWHPNGFELLRATCKLTRRLPNVTHITLYRHPSDAIDGHDHYCWTSLFLKETENLIGIRRALPKLEYVQYKGDGVWISCTRGPDGQWMRRNEPSESTIC